MNFLQYKNILIILPSNAHLLFKAEHGKSIRVTPFSAREDAVLIERLTQLGKALKYKPRDMKGLIDELGKLDKKDEGIDGKFLNAA